MAEKVDVVRAKQLRLDGLSLQEVADEMGCSLAWCKVNLKGVKAPNKDKPIVEDIRKKGKTKEGITGSEVRALVKQMYPSMEGKELETKLAEVKRAARRDNADVLIRPYWMLPEQARDCATAMLDYAHEVWQYKEMLAKKYRLQFDLDSSYHKTVVFGLTSMSAGEYNKLMPQGLLSYGQQLDRLQVELENRQGGLAPQSINLQIDVHVPDTIDGAELVTLDDIEFW